MMNSMKHRVNTIMTVHQRHGGLTKERGPSEISPFQHAIIMVAHC